MNRNKESIEQLKRLTQAAKTFTEIIIIQGQYRIKMIQNIIWEKIIYHMIGEMI